MPGPFHISLSKSLELYSKTADKEVQCEAEPEDGINEAETPGIDAQLYNIKTYNKILSRKRRLAIMMAQNDPKSEEDEAEDNQEGFNNGFGKAIAHENEQINVNNQLKLKLDDDSVSDDSGQK